MTDTDRRVALIADAGFYVGPALSRLMAERGHDLVLGDPKTELVEELTAAGTQVEVVEGARDLSEPDAAGRLVTAGLERFGRIDSATAFSGMIVVGRFLDSTVEDLHTVVKGCMEAPYHFLRANRITDDESRAKVEAMVPMRRLGTMEEFAAFCGPYIDGTSRFTTGQFTAYAGGWA